MFFFLRRCLYSKPELLAASYRVSTGDKACKPLPANIEKELKEEKEACMKAKVIPTKVLIIDFVLLQIHLMKQHL